MSTNTEYVNTSNKKINNFLTQETLSRIPIFNDFII